MPGAEQAANPPAIVSVQLEQAEETWIVRTRYANGCEYPTYHDGEAAARRYVVEQVAGGDVALHR